MINRCPIALNLPDRERVLNHVGVSDEHDRVRLRRFFQAGVGDFSSSALAARSGLSAASVFLPEKRF